MNLSDEKILEIKKHLRFFISDERILVSTLYELMRISPGKWFDIEELMRTSVKNITKDVNLICSIIKTLKEFEYNETTGQIRIKTDVVFIEDVINERTVIFYQDKLDFNEDILEKIVSENDLTTLLVRFLRFFQLNRRDLRPLLPLMKNKLKSSDFEVVVLKMSDRIETIKIQKIISQLYPKTQSCLTITNYFPGGCLSINLPYSKSNMSDFYQNEYESQIMENIGIVTNYIYRANEYSVILDHLIENNLKPLVYRNFVECRLGGTDLNLKNKTLDIPNSYLGCFSVLIYYTKKDLQRATKLITRLITHIQIQTLAELRQKEQKEKSPKENSISKPCYTNHMENNENRLSQIQRSLEINDGVFLEGNDEVSTTNKLPNRDLNENSNDLSQTTIIQASLVSQYSSRSNNNTKKNHNSDRIRQDNF